MGSLWFETVGRNGYALLCVSGFWYVVRTMRTGHIFNWRRWVFEQILVGVGYVSIALAVEWGMMAMVVLAGQAVTLDGLPSREALAAEQVMSLSIHPKLPTIETVTADPWELTAADLAPPRVMYNILTKVGFRILFVQILLGVVLVSVAMAVSNRWLGVQATKQARLATVGVAPGKQEAGEVEAVRPDTLVISIAGTVAVTAKMGVIYDGVRALAGGESGEREYAFSIGGFEMIRVQMVG